MKVQIETLGCKVNTVESESIAELFRKCGHEIVKRGADAVIINTCCVTSEAESKSRQAIRKAVKNGSLVAVMGCYGQLSPDELKEAGANVILGVGERQTIVEKVEKAIKQPSQEKSAFEKVFGEKEHITLPETPETFEDLPHVPSKTRAFMKIQDGCDGKCTYCIIPKVRGKARSRSLKSITKECKSLSQYKEIVLTGINLGMYGRDIDATLIDAIKNVLKHTKARVRLSSINPNLITDELIKLIKTQDRICKHLHIPIQSGSNAVLALMHRPYNVEYFSELVNRLKQEIPTIAIGTDIITGFSGETDKMHFDSMRFIESVPISYMHIFGYSPRPGTIAAEMTQISSQKKKLRVGNLLTLASKKYSVYRNTLKGTTAEVLTEMKNGDHVTGHSGEYMKVYIEGDVPLNEIVQVTLTEPFKDGIIGKINNA